GENGGISIQTLRERALKTRRNNLVESPLNDQEADEPISIHEKSDLINTLPRTNKRRLLDDDIQEGPDSLESLVIAEFRNLRR
ncbi:25954_t:CDS:2, partial [Racocetra persica]